VTGWSRTCGVRELLFAHPCSLYVIKNYEIPGLQHNTVLSESRCALRLWYVDLVVSVEVAVEVCLMS
jgi:hypothetical protein